MKKIILIIGIWLVAVNLFALVCLNRFNLSPDNAYEWMTNYPAKKSWDIISLHARWDSFWYIDMAKNGYHYDPQTNALSNIAFFPLYPALIKLFGTVFAGKFILAGFFVSVISLFGAGIYLYKLVKEFHPEVDHAYPLVLLLIFPAAFFLNAVYTESTFLFFSIATFYYLFKKKFWLAGLFGLLAAATRIIGLILIFPFLWEYFKTFRLKGFLKPQLLSPVLIILPVIGLFTYYYQRFSDFFVFFKVESNWGRSFQFNYDHFSLFSRPAIINLVLDLSFVILSLIMIFLVFRRLKVSYGIYLILSLAVALSTGTLISVIRFIMVLFPIYILIASVKNYYVRYAWTILSTLLFALYTLLFVNYYWAG